MAFSSLPSEVLSICCTRADMSALKALRLTCKSLSSIATRRTFHHLHIKPDPESALKAKNVLDDPNLNRHTTCITFETNEDTKTNAVDAGGPGVFEEKTELPEEWFYVMDRLGQFPKLSRLELKFFSICAGGDDDMLGFREEETPEPPSFRAEVLRRMFKGLNSKDYGIASGVHELSIKNLQDLPEEGVCTSKNFKSVMSRLDTLELCITSDHDFAAPEHSLYLTSQHEFYGHQLTKYWLRPVARNLKKLKLYSTEINWGYFPRTDLCDLHFPQLEELHLGSFTFTHDRQLDWILSHGSTLECLTLSYCAIIHNAFLYGHELDDDRNITERNPGMHGRGQRWEYKTRWHTYFDSICQGLPKLKYFGLEYPGFEEGEAFEKAEIMGIDLSHKRYQILDEGTGPTCWIEPDTPIGAYAESYSCCAASDEEEEGRQLRPPTCQAEDKKAFEELMKVVSTRG